MEGEGGEREAKEGVASCRVADCQTPTHTSLFHLGTGNRQLATVSSRMLDYGVNDPPSRAGMTSAIRNGSDHSPITKGSRVNPIVSEEPTRSTAFAT